MVKGLFPEGTTPAFQPEQVANICTNFIGKTMLEMGQKEEAPEEKK
jgi:hypothetical protein